MAMELKELEAKVKAMGDITDQQKKEMVCVLIGHSRIQTVCFGYFSCGRCGQQLGDTLGSVYPFAERAVVVGHNCKSCRKNYKDCTWQDKYLAPDPFKKES